MQRTDLRSDCIRPARLVMAALASLLPPLTVQYASGDASLQAGEEQSVGEYYQKTYNLRLNPNLPCLNVGGSGKPTYVPAELATVKRGQRKLKLDERQQAQMIREAAIKPGVSC